MLMIMRTSLLMVFCFCLLLNSSSQDSSSRSRLFEKKYAITVAPAVFPFDRIGILTGLQFRINNSWALLTEYGVPVSKGSKDNDIYKQTQMQRFTSEIKYYPKDREPDRFFSLQAGYLHRKFVDPDSGTYHQPNAPNAIGYSRLTVKSPVYFLAVKWGSEAVDWNRVFLDCFFGIGVRIIPTKYFSEGTYNAGSWGRAIDNIAWMAPVPAWEYDKTCIRPHFTIGFRIGGKF